MRDLEQKVDKLSAEIELFKADRNLSGTLLGAGTRKNEG
jgi:hypothetical protein